jgi:acyl-CoA:acyl-CoA alkyltransferase
VRTRRVAGEDICSSDLAASAGREAITKAGLRNEDIDLVIFAAASSDLLEPATANIVQEKIGTCAPVFDLKNACNSFLNGLEVAEAMILTRRYRNVLVAVGEMPSQGVNYNVRNRAHFKACFLGYTLGDAGAAAVVSATEDDCGIFYRAFQTVSRHWEIATFPGGGSMHGNDPEYAYFRGDGQRLRQAFIDVGPNLLLEALQRTGTTFDDYSRIFVHQASVASLKAFCRISGVPEKKVVAVLPRFGNMAAASLPVAFTCSDRERPILAGEMTMWLGLAAGLSLGVMLIRF